MSLTSGLCTRIASLIWSPIVSTGLSEVIGSWKIIAMSPPRSSRNSFLRMPIRSRPSNVAWPATIRPGGTGISPSIDMTLTLLPEPDSPTTPTVSPGKTS